MLLEDNNDDSTVTKDDLEWALESGLMAIATLNRWKRRMNWEGIKIHRKKTKVVVTEQMDEKSQ